MNRTHYIGIDIGGTFVRLISYNPETGYGPKQKFEFARFDDAETEADEICRRIDAYLEETGIDYSEIMGIGISLAAVFDRKTGKIITWSNNKKWNGFPVKSYFRNYFKKSIELEDDANSAAIAEFTLRDKSVDDNFAYITIGTGVGCGLILNGKLFTGMGNAAEIGHLKIANSDARCSCGQKGCLQSIISGPALLKKSRQHVGEINSIEDILAHYKTKAIWAEKILHEFASSIAYTIHTLHMILDLSEVVLGGGVMNIGPVILELTQHHLSRYNHAQYKGREIRIGISTIGESNGAIGATNIIYNRFNNGSFIR